MKRPFKVRRFVFIRDQIVAYLLLYDPFRAQKLRCVRDNQNSAAYLLPAVRMRKVNLQATTLLYDSYCFCNAITFIDSNWI